MIVLGIDPGLDGALAFINPGDDVVSNIIDMPTLALSKSGKKRREVDAHALSNIRFLDCIGHAFIEQAGPRRENGVIQAFSNGRGYGVLIGVLAARGVPMTFVAPNVWKKALSVPKDKDGARARASQLLPHSAHRWPLKKHDGRAESALIALWGIRSLNGIAQGQAA